MENVIKLESVNLWAGKLGVLSCDENGNPLESEIRLYETMPNDWFQNLSAEDREKISIIINDK
jgi:hypothetical protein